MQALDSTRCGHDNCEDQPCYLVGSATTYYQRAKRQSRASERAVGKAFGVLMAMSGGDAVIMEQPPEAVNSLDSLQAGKSPHGGVLGLGEDKRPHHPRSHSASVRLVAIEKEPSGFRLGGDPSLVKPPAAGSAAAGADGAARQRRLVRP